MSATDKALAESIPTELVSTLPTIGPLPSLANRCYFVGQGQRADVVWSRGDFLALCEHMMNGNSLERFIAAWTDSQTGLARFAKPTAARADKRASWAWDTVTGKAKTATGIGFYASNPQHESRWAAIDFDAHNGEDERARKWSVAAFHLLLGHPQLFLILCSSGGGGFHLFIYTHGSYRVGEWIVLLKQTCAFIGAPIADGICEIVPNERAESQRFGKAIRAPGTLNPKTGRFSLIEAENVKPLLDGLSRGWETGVGKVGNPFPRGNGQLSLHERTKYYSLSTERSIESLLTRFPIERFGTRNGVLVRLVGQLAFKFGREIAEQIVKLHYERYKQHVRDPLGEHLRQFEAAWKGLTERVVCSFSNDERLIYEGFTTRARREGFFLVRSFSSLAESKGEDVFPIVRGSFADRLSLTEAGASEVIAALVKANALTLVEPYKPQKQSARFRWIATSQPVKCCLTKS